MPTTTDFVRAAEIEQQIKKTMERVFAAQVDGKTTADLQRKLDDLSEQLLQLRVPAGA